MKQELHKTLLVERESYKSHEGLESYIRELDQQPQRKKARIDSESEESMPELSAGQGSITNDRDNMEVDSEKQTRKRPPTGDQLENRDLKRQKLIQPSWRSNPTHTSGELKRSLHGNNYQLELLILFAWQYKGYVAFRLGTEVAEAGKFDDLVLRYGDDQDRTYRFLQAKHTQHLTEKSNIQYEEFFEVNGDFSLKKYFLSYLDKKNGEKFQDGSIRDVILCTNRNLEENIKDYFEEITAQDEVLGLGGKRYRFSKDQAKRNDVIQKLSRVLNKNTRSGTFTKHTDKTISEFLDQLVLAVGQLSGPNLSNIIKKEIGGEFNLTPVNNVIYNAFYKYMSEWMEHREKDGAGPGFAHFMEHDDLKGFLDDAKIKIAEIVSIGPTSLRRREIEELNIAFEGGTTLNELRGFLTSGDKKQIFNLAAENTLLSAVKVDSVLRSMSLYNEKEDSHIFLRLSTLLILQERFIKAFTSPTDNLLVIECDPISGDREGLYDKLSRIVRNKSNKKVILITKKGNDLANKFKQEFSQLDKYEEKFDDENDFKNLNAGSQQKLLSKNVIFQGKDKRLGELLDSESLKKVVGTNELVELITSDEVKIGGEVDEFSYVPNENLGRELKLNKVSVKVLGEDEGAFILECEKAKKDLESLQGELRTKYGNEQIFVLDTSSAKKKFQKLADKKDRGNIYLLKGQFSELKESKDAKLELKESHGVLNKLRNHIVVDMDGVDNLSEVFVIHGETGIGKTVFLNELCHKHSQSSWVIYVDLFHSSHGIWFSKDFSGDANINSFIKVLKELKKLNSKFEESLFGLALKGEGIKLTIFFDSFDLLGADSQKAILSLLKTLKGHTGLERLGIAVRSYDKHKVEDDLSLLAYELPRLERAGQDTVLNHFIELYGKESEGNSIRESVDRYRRQGGDTSLPITLEILPNIPMPNSDESLDMAQLCQKQLEGMLLKFANSGGVQSGVSEKLKEHISNLALSQSFGKARASADKEFIGFAGHYVGIGGIFDSSRDTNSPALRSFFAEFLSRNHPAIQSIIEKRRNNGFNLNDIDRADDIIKENYYTDVAKPIREYVDWQSVKDSNNPIFLYMRDVCEKKSSLFDFSNKLILLKRSNEEKYYEFLNEKGVLPFAANYYDNSVGLVMTLTREILSKDLEVLDRDLQQDSISKEKRENFRENLFGKYFDLTEIKSDYFFGESKSKNYYDYISPRLKHIRGRSNFESDLIYFAKLNDLISVDFLFSVRLWIYYDNSGGSPHISLTSENLINKSGTKLIIQDIDLIDRVIGSIGSKDNLLSLSVEKKLYHLSLAAMQTESGKEEIKNDKGGKILYNTIYHQIVIVRDQLRQQYPEGLLNERGSDGKAFVHRLVEFRYAKSRIEKHINMIKRIGNKIDISVLDSSGRTIELIAASDKGYQGVFFAILKAFPEQRPKLLESSVTAVEKIKGIQNQLKAFENLLKFRRTILKEAMPQTEEEPYVNDNNLGIMQKIAKLYKQDKNYNKALECFREIHEMKKRSLGVTHEQTLWIELEIISILRKQGESRKALDQLEDLLDLRRNELKIGENDYFSHSILLSAEYEKAMIELLQGSYLIVFDKLEEVLNGVITQLDDGEALYVFQREQLSELLDKLETLEQQGYSVGNLKGLYEEIFKNDENLKEFLGRSKCEKRKAKDKRDVSKMLCVDSRDEEDITKEEKERRTKELFDTGKIRQVANNVEFQDRLFKVSKKISKGEDVIQDIEALVAEVKDIDLSSIDPEIRDIVREMKNNIENKEEIKNILRRSGVAEKIGKVAEGAGLAFTAFLVGKHIANGDVEGLSYDALNLWVMPKIGEKISAEMLALGEKLDSKLLKRSAIGVGYVVSNFLAFIGLAESIKARQNAKGPVNIKIADLNIATNAIFIAADVPAIVTGTMSAVGKEVGVIGEFAGPVGAAISVAVIITSEFVMPRLEVQKLEERIRLTDQEKYELYWDLFFGVGIPRRIEADKEAKQIYEEYISKIVNRYVDYDRMMISLPLIQITTERVTTFSGGSSYSRESISDIELRFERSVEIEHHTEYTGSNISRIIPSTVGNYKAVCGPLDHDVTKRVIKEENNSQRLTEGSLSRKQEVYELSIQKYQRNGTHCEGKVIYDKKGTSSPSKTLLYLPNLDARIHASPKDNLDIFFSGRNIASRVPASFPRNIDEKYAGVHRYFFSNDLLHCSISNLADHILYIKGEETFHCDILRVSFEQNNIVVTQGNFTDFENISSVIGNNKTNYIKVSHAGYVDGKGGSDVITASNSATIRGYFGDSIHGNGLVLLPMNFSNIDKMTYANNVTNIYNKGGEFISIDGQGSLQTADGLFVTPTKVDNKTSRVTNLHVIKRVDSNITLDDELNNLQEIDNLNFGITKQLLCPNSTSIVSNAGHNIFYPDKEHHNFYWEASSDMSHLYIIDQRNANITIARANGVLNFSQLNSTLDDMPFIENDKGEIRIEKDGLNITLLPDYKNVTVTFDEKEYYKLQDGKLERDYCSHNLKIDGRMSINGTDLLNHYNCLTFDSNKVLFFKLEDNLLLLSGKNVLLISAYYSSIYNDWNLSMKLNDGIIEPEKFRERADSPSTFRYYRPDERGLGIYHNQPTNKYQIGLMDLRNNSISEWGVRIVDGHLIVSLKNKPITQVKNWSISQLAREITFVFNDTVVFNEGCIVLDCNPEDIIEEFEEERVKFFEIIDTPLLSALRKGDLDEFKSHFSNSSSTINDDVDLRGNKLLHYAAYFNKPKIAKFILENNYDINPKSNSGQTPLDVARKYGRSEMVKVLEEAERRKDVHPMRHRRHKQHHREHLQDGRRVGATSGASKPSSWISDLFVWVKDSVGGLFGSKVTLPEKPGNSTVQSLPNISQHNETAKGSSPSSFLSVENVALIGCIADALDNTQSKCYQTSKSQGVNFVPSIQTAVNFARREFDSFVEDKIRNLDSKEKARIRTEVKNAYPEIIESFGRGVEFSGNIGLDDVLGKCKRCFCTNMLPNNVSQSESQMLGKTDDKPETRLSDVTVNNQQITGHTK